MLTRKHYTIIADAIASATLEMQDATVQSLAYKIGCALEKDNPRFDHYKFAERINEQRNAHNPLDREYRDFTIATVCRADLVSAGYNAKKTSDATLAELASKMGNAYCENGFWVDLPIIADYLKIPKSK